MGKIFGIILLGVGINIAYSWISCSRKTSWTLFVFTALLSLGLDCFNGFSPIETFSNGVTYLMTKSIVILALMYFLYLLHYLLTEKAEWFKPSEQTKSSLNLMRLLFYAYTLPRLSQSHFKHSAGSFFCLINRLYHLVFIWIENGVVF